VGTSVALFAIKATVVLAGTETACAVNPPAIGVKETRTGVAVALLALSVYIRPAVFETVALLKVIVPVLIGEAVGLAMIITFAVVV